MELTLLIGGAFFALLAVGIRIGQRRAEARRFALGVVLSEQGYPDAKVEWGESTYGWPGYRIVFPSEPSREEYRDSADHRALLDEIRLLHQDRADFDPSLACELSIAEASSDGRV